MSDTKTYIVTGVTGYLGNVVVRYLLNQKRCITGLLLPGEKNPFPEIKAVYGDVTDKESLRSLFSGKNCTVIHCAGKVSISSFDGLSMWNTNVMGTRNMVDLAIEYQVEKFIYVSSVHAIPEKSGNHTITEVAKFCPDDVVGDYAKTKAEATKYVMDAIGQGFPACVVHPSGIIGPYDMGCGQMSTVVRMYLKGQLPAGVTGGYVFVDVRDVVKGIIACCEKGKIGECYILSGHYYTVEELLRLTANVVSGKQPVAYIPHKMLKPIAGVWETLLYKFGKTTVFTPYSLYTLGSNGHFSHEKAERELGYTVRSREQTVNDMVRWIFKNDEKKGQIYEK